MGDARRPAHSPFPFSHSRPSFSSVTNPFQYSRAQSAEDAAQILAGEGAVPLGGGTDLLVTVHEQLIQPDVLVDLRTIPGSEAVEEIEGGALRIGASARVSDLAGHPLVRERYPVLSEACDVVGTPALRHMGTIGGNL